MKTAEAVLEMLERGGWMTVPADEREDVVKLIDQTWHENN